MVDLSIVFCKRLPEGKQQYRAASPSGQLRMPSITSGVKISGRSWRILDDSRPGDVKHSYCLNDPVEIVDFPMKNGDFPMKNGDFP